MTDPRSGADTGPAYPCPTTTLSAALAGEHAARTLGWLAARSHPDRAGRLVLDMPLEEARELVRALDAWCDWLDDTPERQPEGRVALAARPPGTGEWLQQDGARSSWRTGPRHRTPTTVRYEGRCAPRPGQGGAT